VVCIWADALRHALFKKPASAGFLLPVRSL
jgi:hypothetical protein